MTLKSAERTVSLQKLEAPSKADPGMKQFAAQVNAALQTLAEQHNRNDDQLQQFVRGGASAENNSRIVYRDLEVMMPKDAPWLDITFSGTWANVSSYQPAQYLMKPGGEAEMRGYIEAGGAAQFTVLPSGYAPPNDSVWPITAPDLAPMLISSSGVCAILSGAFGSSYSINSRWIASPIDAETAMPHPFVAGGWPIIVRHGFDKALGCELVAARATTNISGPNGTGQLDWEDIGNGQLRLNGVWGLQWGRRYNMRLRINAEKS